MAIENSSVPLRVFCCYAHEDEPMRDRLEQQLAALKRRKLISVKHDRDITAGAEWRKEIERELNDADLILLLISASFLDSDFCASVELERAINRSLSEPNRKFLLPAK